MDIITIIFVVVISAVLFACSAVVIIKLFGTGIFYGLDIYCITIMTETDNIHEKLSDISESLGTECISSSLKIIIIDGGMNTGQREICRSFCEKHSYFIMTTPDKTNDVLFSLKNTGGL